MNIVLVAIGLSLMILSGGGVAGILPLATVGGTGPFTIDKDSVEINVEQDSKLRINYELCNDNPRFPKLYGYHNQFVQIEDSTGVVIEGNGNSRKPINPGECRTQYYNSDNKFKPGEYKYTIHIYAYESTIDDMGNDDLREIHNVKYITDQFTVEGAGTGGVKPVTFQFYNGWDKWNIEVKGTDCPQSPNDWDRDGNNPVCDITMGDKIEITAEHKQGGYGPVWIPSPDCGTEVGIENELNRYTCPSQSGGRPVPIDGFTQDKIVLYPYGKIGLQIREGSQSADECTVKWNVSPQNVASKTNPRGNDDGETVIFTVDRGDTKTFTGPNFVSLNSGYQYKFKEFVWATQNVDDDQIEVTSGEENTLEFYCPTMDEAQSSKYRNHKDIGDVSIMYERFFASYVDTSALGPGTIDGADQFNGLDIFEKESFSVEAIPGENAEFAEWVITGINSNEERTDGNAKLDFDAGGDEGSVFVMAYFECLNGYKIDYDNKPNCKKETVIVMQDDRGEVYLEVNFATNKNEHGEITEVIGKGTEIVCSWTNDVGEEKTGPQTADSAITSYVWQSSINFIKGDPEQVSCQVEKDGSIVDVNYGELLIDGKMQGITNKFTLDTGGANDKTQVTFNVLGGGGGTGPGGTGGNTPEVDCNANPEHESCNAGVICDDGSLWTDTQCRKMGMNITFLNVTLMVLGILLIVAGVFGIPGLRRK